MKHSGEHLFVRAMIGLVIMFVIVEAFMLAAFLIKFLGNV